MCHYQASGYICKKNERETEMEIEEFEQNRVNLHQFGNNYI